MNFIQQLAIICPMVFLAGFIDSIAGGGGLISLPAYATVLSALPSTVSLGTNKFSAVWGTLIASAKYIRSKKYHKASVLISIVFSLVGSAIGSQIAKQVDNTFMKYLIIGAVPVLAIFILTKKDLGEPKEHFLSPKKILGLSAGAAFFIGMYDGFLGPGTGTFLVLFFTSVIGFDLVTASGNAKIINLASNIAACVNFALSGQVLYSFAIPAALCSIAGNYIGAHLAIQNGKKIIKPIFIVVLVLLLGSMVVQVYQLQAHN